MPDIWIEVLKDYSIFIIGGLFGVLFYLYRKNEANKEQQLKDTETRVKAEQEAAQKKLAETEEEASKDLDNLKKDIEKKLDSIQLTVEKTHEFVIRQDEKNKIVMERIEELYTEVSSLWKHHNNLKTRFENLLVEHKHTHNLKNEIE